ncbi:hypothetical protein Tco_0078451 [Tanacetum coccineum]
MDYEQVINVLAMEKSMCEEELRATKSKLKFVDRLFFIMLGSFSVVCVGFGMLIADSNNVGDRINNTGRKLFLPEMPWMFVYKTCYELARLTLSGDEGASRTEMWFEKDEQCLKFANVLKMTKSPEQRESYVDHWNTGQQLKSKDGSKNFGI